MRHGLGCELDEVANIKALRGFESRREFLRSEGFVPRGSERLIRIFSLTIEVVIASAVVELRVAVVSIVACLGVVYYRDVAASPAVSCGRRKSARLRHHR
jgi:hypothetical protein